ELPDPGLRLHLRAFGLSPGEQALLRGAQRRLDLPGHDRAAAHHRGRGRGLPVPEPGAGLMAEDMIKVRIASPVKLGARWLKPGDQPEVTAGEEAELKAAGVLDLGPDTALPTSAGETVTVTVEQFQQAVAAQAKALSDAVTSAAIEGACA